MAPKRQRKAKQPFDQGVNPSSQKRKTPQSGQDLAQSTPKRVRRNALPSPPATARPRCQSPLFELEPQATQTAASAQADDLASREDEDTLANGDTDPLPEEDLEGAPEDEIEEPAYRRLVGTPLLPRSSQEPQYSEPVVNVRWRACLGSNMEKHPILEAADSEHGMKLYSLQWDSLWQWVDSVVADLKPKRVKVSTICAVVYPARQAKRDRSIKSLRRGKDSDWDGLRRIVEQVDYGTSEVVYVDFDLILAEVLEEQPPLQPPSTVVGVAPRRRTATIIQEDGLAGAIAAEQAGSGHAIAIRDKWRCIDSNCRNYPYTCWWQSTSPGQPIRFENHYEVNGNIIAMWARAISQRLATYDEPSDDVRLAIMRAKDRRVHEKHQRLQADGGVEDDIKSLTKLLIVGQLNQMNRQPLQGSICQEAIAPKPPDSRTSTSSEWVPIEYGHEREIIEHTLNFFNYFKLKHPTNNEGIDDMYTAVVSDGAMDINMLMQPSHDSLRLWVTHFNIPPGWFFTLQNDAKKWRGGYQGLTDRNWRRVQRSKQREEKFAKKLPMNRRAAQWRMGQIILKVLLAERLW